MGVVTALFAGGLVGAGVWLIVLGVRGVPTRGCQVRRSTDRKFVLRFVLAAGTFLLVIVVTGWPVGAVLAGAAAAVSLGVIGGRAVRGAVIAKIEAIATWAEMLRDTVAAGAGLAEAIRASAAVASALIAGSVRALSLRMEWGRLVPALRAFADDVADPMADLIVAALILAALEQARRLGELLGALAAAIREQVVMRMRVDASRARTRSAATAVTGISLFAAIGFLAFDRPFLDVYDIAEGQFAFALIGLCFATAFYLLVWMGQ